MNPIKLTEKIYWVGAIDWNVRDFHGYSTNRGTTYNAYLIMDEKITLVDTVKSSLKDDLISRISEIVDPKKIDYIVVNHVEMDHSGALPDMVDLIQPEKIICSKMGEKALRQHFHRDDWPYEIAVPGEDISLGSKTLSFLETRMLHWPDSMFTYVVEDKLLFSSDAFGMHLASSERFDDEISPAILMDEMTKYYANILTLYSPLVKKLIAKVQEIGLEIDMIAPDHGVVWRSNPMMAIEAYDRWSRNEGKGNALVIYDTMWHSTEKMAKEVAAGLQDEGVSVKLLNLRYCHRSDVMSEVLDASAIVLGCSTLNNGLLPRMAGFLMYMRGLRPANKIGAAFGSFGWSGEAVKLLNASMEEMKFDVVDDGLKVKYVPESCDLSDCVALGRKVGQALKN
ncbi:MAG: flavodoxin domain-containing protein [Desulfobulbaceae bacterium]|uniref:Flavodoxin domain-containing protein n=1 Tax=Candidatus Desulfatifera sulfidica TaxID=2841691 RepID=A0A8J6TA89_9BACT|nr:flavodoxin domain-containing protein [Candidatus Desulfatifera sulfidica]